MTMLNNHVDKILLINPPGRIYVDENGPVQRKHCFPPIGLAYIAASALKHGYTVDVIDALAEGYATERIDGRFIIYGLTNDEIIERIRKAKPDLIGISILFTMNVCLVETLCGLIKEEFAETLIALGGYHPSAMPQRVMKDTNIDYLIQGEGDNIFPLLLDALNGLVEFEKVPALYYRINGDVRHTMKHVNPIVKGNGWNYYSIKDAGVPRELNDLPYPAWHLFPMQEYWNSNVRIGGGDVARERYAVMVSTRGCPNACTFCSSSLISGYKGFRTRSSESIVNEIHWLVKEFNINEVIFMDDNFFSGKSRLKKLLRILADEFPDLLFQVPTGTEVKALDEEVIDLMAKANFYKVVLAVEAGSEEIQQTSVEKKVPLDQVPKMTKLIKNHKIETRAIFMIGFPGETRKQIEETLNLAITLDVDDFYISIVNAFPGTPLFDECLENNLFVSDFSINELRFSRCNIKLPDTTPEEIEKFRRTVWLEAFEKRRKKLDVAVKDKKYCFTKTNEYETDGFKSLDKITIEP